MAASTHQGQVTGSWYARNREAINAKRRAARAEARRPTCRSCGATITDALNIRKAWHDQCRPSKWRYNREELTRACATCGGEFTTRYMRQRFCSTRCQLKAQNTKPYRQASNRRFPRIRYGARRAILERDGWRCGLCGAVIDPQQKWPAEGAPTIDHIDPDGPHEPSNWQAAHNACNREKGHSTGLAA